MRSGQRLRVLVALFFSFHVFGEARADDGVRLTREPSRFTDVIDAFDADDAFDLDISTRFLRRSQRASLSRERGTERVAFADVGHFSNILELSMDIGVFRDVALFARFPVVLSDDRDLSLGERDASEVDSILGPRGFAVPFQSPTRSGLDRAMFGLAFSPLNQFRRDGYPTMTIRLGLDLGVGSLLSPCESGDEMCAPGVTGGTHAVTLAARFSRRYPWVEPYAGVDASIGFRGRADDAFAPAVSRNPPSRASLTVGASFIPWESPAELQRMSIDFALTAGMDTAGRGFSVLYDALGATSETSSTGVTELGARSRFGITAGVELRAARYIWFGLGATLGMTGPARITGANGCDGECSDDPAFRVDIDSPGARFYIERALLLETYISAGARF